MPGLAPSLIHETLDQPVDVGLGVRIASRSPRCLQGKTRYSGSFVCSTPARAARQSAPVVGVTVRAFVLIRAHQPRPVCPGCRSTLILRGGVATVALLLCLRLSRRLTRQPRLEATPRHEPRKAPVRATTSSRRDGPDAPSAVSAPTASRPSELSAQTRPVRYPHLPRHDCRRRLRLDRRVPSTSNRTLQPVLSSVSMTTPAP